jgi:hypothetical protein
MSEQDCIVIKGVTRGGRPFRPADWAQRLATAVGRPGADRRVLFHPQVHMAMREGVSCVIVDARLKDLEPRLFAFLLNFAESNELQIEKHAGPLPG